MILICAVLLFAIYISISTLALAIWGDSVMGTVDSYESRLDDSNAGSNRSRTVSKGYWFMANGCSSLWLRRMRIYPPDIR